MKSLTTFTVFCFVLCMHPAFGQQNYQGQQNQGLYKSGELLLPWTNIKSPASSLSISTAGINNRLLATPVLFEEKYQRYMPNSASLNGSEQYVTFNAKWESLMGKPLLDTSDLYFPALKIKNVNANHYSQLYRATATIFNFAVITKYPYLNAPK